MEVLWVAIVVVLLIAVAFKGGGGTVGIFGALGMLMLMCVIAFIILYLLWNASHTLFFITLAIWVCLIGWAIYYLQRSEKLPGKVRQKFRQPLADQRRAMIAESELLSSGVYRHPSGLFLAQGPRGGTRAFKTKEAAEEYASR